MTDSTRFPAKSFLQHLKTTENKQFIWLAAGIAVFYFFLLRIIYPIPSYCGDSYTFIATARFDYPVSYRPVLYSRYLNFFHHFSKSDVALIAAQYASNVVANLFLFFTCTWIFALRKTFRSLLFLLLIVNPFYLLYSNYITSDPFFNSYTIVWFTLLIWMMYKPMWWQLFAQLVILSQLFFLRYNAIIFPVFLWLAVFIGKHSPLKKIATIVSSSVMIVAFVLVTKQKTLRHTGTETFTGFSGWQLANNALHILRYERADTTKFEDEQAKFLANYCNRFFDTSKLNVPAVSSYYMWFYKSPLKEYTKVYKGRDKHFFKTWTALGPVYNNFATDVIIQNPTGYVKHFVLPNTQEYFIPRMEIYNNYFEHVDTIGKMAREFYGYQTDTISKKKQFVYDIVFTPWKYLFLPLNLLLIGLGLYYITTKKYRAQQAISNQAIGMFAMLFGANFFFIVLMAPSVFRYHIFIITLSYPVILMLMQNISGKRRAT